MRLRTFNMTNMYARTKVSVTYTIKTSDWKISECSRRIDLLQRDGSPIILGDELFMVAKVFRVFISKHLEIGE